MYLGGPPHPPKYIMCCRSLLGGSPTPPSSTLCDWGPHTHTHRDRQSDTHTHTQTHTHTPIQRPGAFPQHLATGSLLIQGTAQGCVSGVFRAHSLFNVRVHSFRDLLTGTNGIIIMTALRGGKAGVFRVSMAEFSKRLRGTQGHGGAAEGFGI